MVPDEIKNEHIILMVNTLKTFKCKCAMCIKAHVH